MSKSQNSHVRFAIGVAAIASIGFLSSCSNSSSTSSTDRQTMVHHAGSLVMPFDLNKTMHSFVNNDTGGVESVVAIDPNDAEQIGLIREHLSKISAQFAAGNFDDPTAIHGAGMPGLQTLKDNSAELSIVYSEMPTGAMITYSSTDPMVVSALHDWFDAQLADHGSDAMSMPADQQMTKEMWQMHHPNEPYPGNNATN